MKIILMTFLLFSMNAMAAKISDFRLPIHGSEATFHLSENIKGKKVLMNFWATWCTSCIQEIPLLESLKSKYGNEVIFVAVNAGEKSNLIERFLKKHKFSYILFKDEDRSFSKSLGVESLPVTLVIDKDMNVVYRGIVPPKEL